MYTLTHSATTRLLRVVMLLQYYSTLIDVLVRRERM
jgi:hypothetical protein